LLLYKKQKSVQRHEINVKGERNAESTMDFLHDVPSRGHRPA